MKNEYCKGCDDKSNCKNICPELEAHIKTTKDRAMPLSGNYIDRAFPFKEAAEALGNLRISHLESRGKAMRKVIKHFKGFGDNGILFFWVWHIRQNEGMSQSDLAVMLGMSQQRVSQILQEIEKPHPE